MGIGLFVEAKIAGRGLLGRKPGRDQIFSQLRKSIQEYLTDPLMARLIAFGSHEHTFYVRLHPCAEPVEFTWKPDQSITVSAKTSTVGPGYHAFLIELLQHLDGLLHLKWNWSEESADEAGFVQSGDFAALQQEMAKFWKSLGRILLEQMEEGSKNLMLNMSLGYPLPQLDAFVITPLGPLSRECCNTMQTDELNDLVEICRQYFIWWNKEPNAAFWRNTGLSIMWCDVPWHIPFTEEERNICQLALDCMTRAKELDDRIKLPNTEVEELQSLLADGDKEPQPPKKEGIGYRRHQMQHQLTGGWSLCFPGYYFQDSADDGAGLIFWFGSRTIRFSSFTVTRKPGVASSPQDLLESKDKEKENGSEIIEINKDHVQGWASIQRSSGNDEDYWMLQGQAACSDTLGIATICYTDPADKNWAIETFKSIMHPPSNS